MVRRLSTAAAVRVRRFANRVRARSAVRRRMRPVASQAAAIGKLMRRGRRLSSIVRRRPTRSFSGQWAAMMRGTPRALSSYKRPRLGRVVRRTRQPVIVAM